MFTSRLCYGYGGRNAEGEEILRTCSAADLSIVNTYFKKSFEHLIIYRSRRHANQTDFLLNRRHQISKVANCKIIPGLTAQHRLLVMDLRVEPKVKHVEYCQRQIQWWRLNQSKSQAFAAAIGGMCAGADGERVQDHWDRIQATSTGAAKAVLGMTKGGQKCQAGRWTKSF